MYFFNKVRESEGNLILGFKGDSLLSHYCASHSSQKLLPHSDHFNADGAVVLR